MGQTTLSGRHRAPIPHQSFTEKQLHSAPIPNVLGLFLSQARLDVAGFFEGGL
jgi:hypothetical protein